MHVGIGGPYSIDHILNVPESHPHERHDHTTETEFRSVAAAGTRGRALREIH